MRAITTGLCTDQAKADVGAIEMAAEWARTREDGKTDQTPLAFFPVSTT
jgi:hypothetical protein